MGELRRRLGVGAEMSFDPVAFAAAGDGAAYERAALAYLDRVVGYDVAFFVTLGCAPTTTELDPRALEVAFASRTYEHELAPVKAAAMQRRGVAIDTEVLGEDAARRCAYFREFVAPRRGRHSLMAYLAVRGRPFGAVMLGRTGSAFTEPDVARVEADLPYVSLGRASYFAPRPGDALPGVGGGALLDRAAAWVRGERVLADVETGQGRVTVRDRRGHREMVSRAAGAELVWTRADLADPRRSGWFYVDLFHLAAARARYRGRALFVGCGGAVGVRQFAEVYPGIAIDVVEVDDAVVALARDWYGLGAIPNVTVHVADGADFLAAAEASTWDVVVVDAYDAADLPDRVTRPAFFRACGRALRPGGAVAINTIGSLLAGASSVRAVERAARAELSDVRLVPVLDPGEAFSPHAVRNVIVLASRP